MEYRLWDYEADNCLIESFLLSSSMAHGISQKDESWFNWKYRDCPDGRSLLMCAFDGDNVVGCVAMRIGRIYVDGQHRRYGASYENFVHPAYQGRGIFVRLIECIEAVCKEEGLEFLICFPNSNSLAGYLKAGWLPQKVMRSKIKLIAPLRVLKNISSLGKCFQVKHSRADVVLLSKKQLLLDSKSRISPIWSKEYLRWRFGVKYTADNCYVDNADFFAIARVGYRGALKECQIITVMTYGAYPRQRAFADFVKYIEQKEAPDIVSCSYSMYSDFSVFTRRFITVPTKINFVYKVIKKGSVLPGNIAMDAMFFHTY